MDKPKKRRSGERRARDGAEETDRKAPRERARKAAQPDEREEEATDAVSEVRQAPPRREKERERRRPAEAESASKGKEKDGAKDKGGDGPDRAEYSQTAAKLLRKLRKSLVLEPTGQVALEDRYLKLMGRIGDRAVPPLKEGLRDPRWEARYAAAAALHYLSRKRYAARVSDALNELTEAVRDERPQVRAKALEALGTLRAQKDEVLPTIIKALGDESAEVSRAAVAQVLELSKDPRRTTKLMVKVLERRKNELARLGALMVLFHLGKEAKDAVPVLLPLLEDDSAAIREYAHLALMGIRTPSMRLEIIRTSSMRLKVADEGSEAPSGNTPDEDSLEEMDEQGQEEDDEGEDDQEESADETKKPAKRRPRIPRRRKTRRRR